MIVNRGPQFVQLVKGYRCLRSAGSSISAEHASHVAMSGETSVISPASVSDSRIVKSAKPSHATLWTWTRCTTAIGGASARTASANAATAEAAPSTTIVTPRESLLTQPVRPRERARL